MNSVIFDQKKWHKMEKWIQGQKRKCCRVTLNPLAYCACYTHANHCHNWPHIESWTSVETSTLVFYFKIVVSKSQWIRTKLVFTEIVLKICYFHAGLLPHCEDSRGFCSLLSLSSLKDSSKFTWMLLILDFFCLLNISHE